jgi:hypothetical protein
MLVRRTVEIMLKTKLALVGCLALAAVGCTETVESSDIRTSGIYPEITVEANGSGSSTVTVRLKVGGDDSNTFLELTGDDTLEATVGDDTKTLDETGSYTYRASFPVDAEGTEFVIGFIRGDADDSAPASVVSLPAPFDLSLGATEASRADDDLEFTWDPPGSGNVTWDIEGDCIKHDDGSTPDDGTNTLEAGSIETFDSDKEETCTVDLQVRRQRSGDIDGAFTEGGSIVARHVRTESFTSAP